MNGLRVQSLEITVQGLRFVATFQPRKKRWEDHDPKALYRAAIHIRSGRACGRERMDSQLHSQFPNTKYAHP